jgi:hypothetical protein
MKGNGSETLFKASKQGIVKGNYLREDLGDFPRRRWGDGVRPRMCSSALVPVGVVMSGCGVWCLDLKAWERMPVLEQAHHTLWVKGSVSVSLRVSSGLATLVEREGALQSAV